MTLRRSLWTLLLATCLTTQAATSRKLTGTVIGSAYGYDYSTNKSSSTVNIRTCAFDGNFSSFFAASTTSGGWVGLDLGKPCVITKVGYAAANRSNGPARTLLGIFEGANQADFSDALPLQMIKEEALIGTMTYASVSVTRGFRYVRYKGYEGTRSTMAELEFWGYVGTGSDARFFQITNLPTVVISTTTGQDPQDKVNEIASHISIISDDGYTLFQQDGTSRLRGNNSMTHPKKPYRIKFDEKQRVLGSPAKAKKWTLINNYGDKTLMRNCIAFEISQRLGIGFTPFCQPVDVIMNSDYKGCYQLCDAIDVRKHRVDICEMDSTCTEGEALTGGYLIEIDAYASKEPKYFTSSRSTPVTIKYPDDDDILTVQFNYIKQYYNSFETAVYKTSTWKDPETGYRKYLNLPSFHRHFLVGELSGNTDTYWSTYMYKDRSETQFFVEPVWDFDLAFENDSRTYPICSQTDYIYRTKGSHAGNFHSIVSRIMVNDLESVADVQELWGYARYQNGITVESLQAYVDSMAAVLDASERLNFIRWPIMNKKVHQNPVIWGSYEAEVQNVKDYLERRIAWLDKKLKYDEQAFADHIAESPAGPEPEVHIWGRHVYVSGIPGGQSYQVFSPSGALEGQGESGQEGPLLAPGLHIISVQDRSVKVLVRE